jgi:hypothetical protein
LFIGGCVVPRSIFSQARARVGADKKSDTTFTNIIDNSATSDKIVCMAIQKNAILISCDDYWTLLAKKFIFITFCWFLIKNY